MAPRSTFRNGTRRRRYTPLPSSRLAFRAVRTNPGPRVMPSMSIASPRMHRVIHAFRTVNARRARSRIIKGIDRRYESTLQRRCASETGARPRSRSSKCRGYVIDSKCRYCSTLFSGNTHGTRPRYCPRFSPWTQGGPRRRGVRVGNAWAGEKD